MSMTVQTELYKGVQSDLFDRLKNVKELSEDETKETVAKIIATLKEANITYDCAHEILDVTRQTLSKMQGALAL